MLKNKLMKRINVQTDITQNVINEQTHFSVLEAYKAARTNIMFTLAGEEGCKKVMVVSTGSGEGKSTTAINLAISFAQTGAKILIIEADLRRPMLHRYLDLPNDVGLSEYLGGFVKNHRDIIQNISGYEKFDCITGGHIPPNPSELLLSPAMKQLIDDLSKDYEYIFVDTPPLNYVTDAASIAKLMTGTIVVVRQNYATTDALKQAISSLQFSNGKILGYVFNSVKVSASRQYYKNNYAYKYVR